VAPALAVTTVAAVVFFAAPALAITTVAAAGFFTAAAFLSPTEEGSGDEAALLRFVLIQKLLDAGERVLHGLLHHLQHRRRRALEGLVVALPLRRVEDRRRQARAHQEQVHEEARRLPAVDGEG